MEQVMPRLWVGDDADYERVKNRPEWATLRACKDGPDGHRDTLGYKTMSAPKDANYLSVRTGNRLSLNIVDSADPSMFPPGMIKTALDFIKDQLAEGYSVLVACNQGQSRGPSIALMFMRSIGEMPYNFLVAERMFRAIYPQYDPALGIRQFMRMHWSSLEKENKDELGKRS